MVINDKGGEGCDTPDVNFKLSNGLSLNQTSQGMIKSFSFTPNKW
jgi:hypothetical protein